jgi:hypothetical protein
MFVPTDHVFWNFSLIRPALDRLVEGRVWREEWAVGS